MAKQIIQSTDAKKGMVLKGPSHKDGGIDAIVVNASNKIIEVEGQEVVVCKNAIQNPEVYTVTGTTRDIVSALNKKGGGVSLSHTEPVSIKKIMEKGGSIVSDVAPFMDNMLTNGIVLTEGEGEDKTIIISYNTGGQPRSQLLYSYVFMRQAALKVSKTVADSFDIALFNKRYTNFDPAMMDEYLSSPNFFIVNNNEVCFERQTKKKLESGGTVMDQAISDPWLDIPDANKVAPKIRPILFTKDPVDKNFQKIVAPFEGRDDLKIKIAGTSFEDNGIWATDGHKLIYLLKDPNSTKRGIYCTTPGCEKLISRTRLRVGQYDSETHRIDEKYVNAEAVIPTKSEIIKQVDVNKLRVFLHAVLKSGYTDKITNRVILSVDSEKRAFNGKMLLTILDTCLLLGHEQVTFALNGPSKALLVVMDTKYNGQSSPVGSIDFMLLMPIMIKDGESYLIDNDEVKRDLVYSINTNEVIVNSEKYSTQDIHAIDQLNKPQSKNKELIDVLGVITNKKSYILDFSYVYSQSGTLFVRSGLVRVEIKNTGYPTGVYEVKGSGLLPTSKQTIDNIPKPKTENEEKFEHVLTIATEQFLKEFEIASTYVGKDDLKPLFSTVHIEKIENEIVIESTDAYSAYRGLLSVNSSENKFNELIQEPVLIHRILKSVELNSVVEIHRSQDFIRIVSGNLSITVERDKSNYPNLLGVYPSRVFQTLTVKQAILKTIQKEMLSIKKQIESRQKQKSEGIGCRFHQKGSELSVLGIAIIYDPSGELKSEYKLESESTGYKTYIVLEKQIPGSIVNQEIDLKNQYFSIYPQTYLKNSKSVFNLSEKTIKELVKKPFSEIKLGANDLKPMVLLNEYKAPTNLPNEIIQNNTDNELEKLIDGLQTLSEIETDETERQKINTLIDGLKLLL